MICVDNLHKAYHRTIAVHGLSFQVGEGQILGLVGPNGAGKSTTMRAISGLVPFAHGRITVAGFDVQRQSIDIKRRLAYLPDEPQFFPELTVQQHLAFIASVYDVDEAQQKVGQLLDQFQLRSQSASVTRNLSRGMRQKLAICCAYLYDPVALLFDEPLTGLDPHGIRLFKETVVSRAAAGAAVIVSSHLLAIIEDICTEVLILADGREKFWGPLSELRYRYAEQQPTASLESVFFQATANPSAELSTVRP